jgi:hypothetical protein
MSKKEIVNEIIAKLKSLGVDKDGCQMLNIELPSGNKLSWVGYNQIMISVRLGGALFRNKRYRLYSKDVDENMLNLINKNLKK